MDVYLKFQGGVFSLCRRFNCEGREYGKRGDVSVFSSGSRRRMLKYLRSSVARYWAIGTLTYPSEFDASDFVSHWRSFVERWRRVYGADDNNSLFWFVEFQGNGQPHIHFYTNHFIEKGWLACAWASVVKSGNADHYKAGTSIEKFRSEGAVVSYAAKYAAKSEQKTVPPLYADKKGFRWWGVVGQRSVVSAAIKVDDLEYVYFDLCELVKTVSKLKSKVLFSDFGATVWAIESRSDYFMIYKAFKRANKVLLQAEQKERSRIYSERR